jgi:probable rRNA maturation factor
MAAEGGSPEAQVSLVICGDRRMRRLNREWRGFDKTTDVLSFSQRENPADASPFPEAPKLLGDVIISAAAAERQARQAGKSFSSELHFLLVHGILHLLGWQDDTRAQRQAMLARQQELMEKL